MVEFSFSSDATQRLDMVLLGQVSVFPEFDGLSRAQLQRWIEQGQVSVDGEVWSKSSWAVKPNSKIAVQIPKEKPTEFLPSGRALEILYQDDDLLVINKPCGLSMHPGAGRTEDTLVHAIVGYLSPEELASGKRPGIVHRLDMDTTGIVVVAKTVHAHFALARQFAEKTTKREYVALAFTTPRSKGTISKKDAGKVDTLLGRHPSRRKEIAVVVTGGRRAISRWRVLERTPYAALVSVVLETGRTHQIRVHLTHLGAPVIGDNMYGDFSGLPAKLKVAATRFGRQALHARVLGFVHPTSGETMHFEKEAPSDFTELVDVFRRWS